MGKSFKFIKAHKQVHRSLLKSAGAVHLPAHQVQDPKTVYNRKKVGKKVDLRKIQTD